MQQGFGLFRQGVYAFFSSSIIVPVMQTMERSHQSGRYKVVGWFLLLLLWQLCPVVLAAKQNVERSLSVGATASGEYGAFLKQARFAPSLEQQKEVESLFAQLNERHITIKPSLYKLLALACLLYTSPSPRDRQKSRMPSSA